VQQTGRVLGRAITSGFVPVFVAALLVTLLTGGDTFYYDSGGYWNLSKIFTLHGAFDLYAFDDPTRGYAFPFLLLVWSTLTDFVLSDVALVKVLNSLLFALISCVLAPAFVRTVWPERDLTVWHRLALAALLIVSWRGSLDVPLSDFPALALALTAIVLAGRASPLSLLGAGVATSLAINTRPAYVLLVPAILLISLWRWRHGELHKPALGIALLVIAMALVALPQALINRKHFDTLSPLAGAGAHLSTFQLSVGLTLQRYDSNVGPNYPAQMKYLDGGTETITGEGRNRTIKSYGEYLSIFIEHPVVLIRAWGRRLVNGFDQRYASVYVTDVVAKDRALRLLNFTCVFLALLRLLWPAARRGLGRTRWGFLLALLVTCASVPMSAVETRFLLPAYLLAYLLVLLPGWPNPLRSYAVTRSVRRLATPAVILVAYVGFIAAMWVVTRDTTRSLDPQPTVAALPR
jgi:4-amino-4-deoxy-L-arabinose transferase-like glycosyltransferase